MSLNWSPNDDYLNHILNLLKSSLSNDNEVQKYVFLEYEKLKYNSEFPNYLSYIISETKENTEYSNIRRSACLSLKSHTNYAWSQYSIVNKLIVKHAALICIDDSNEEISKAGSTLIASIVSINDGTELNNWPELLPHLINIIEPSLISNEPAILAKSYGAFSTLHKICQDVPDQLADSNDRPLNIIIPKLIQFFTHPNVQFRIFALSSINQFLFNMPPALNIHAEECLKGLFILANDTNHKIRIYVCRAFGLLVERRMNLLTPFMKDIIYFNQMCFTSGDEELAFEACEFWHSFCCVVENPNLHLLSNIFPQLLPVLLNGMILSEQELINDSIYEKTNNTNVPDRPEDIKPVAYNYQNPNDDDDDEEAGDDGDDNDDEFDGDDTADWTFRKCCGNTLSRISHVYGAEILTIVLPILQEKFADVNNWLNRESGLLALGSISGGCYNGLEPHLAQLVPFLISLLGDEKPLIRTMTCWVLSRFSHWIVNQEDPQIYSSVVALYLQRMVDPMKKVQQTACTGFSAIEEASTREQLCPFLSNIVHVVRTAFTMYQANNLVALYDVVATLAETIRFSSDMNNELCMLLFEPLMAKYNSLTDDDPALCKLFECLRPVASSMRHLIAPWAKNIVNRCISIIDSNVMMLSVCAEAESRGEVADYPSHVFLVSALDVLSGVTEGLGGGIDELIANTNAIPLLFQCCLNTHPEVRQGAFAVFGDLSKFSFGHLRPHLDKFLPVVIDNLRPEYNAVCTNACWSIGECCIKAGPAVFKPFGSAILDKLIIPLTNNFYQERSRVLMTNIAITIGRIAIVCPEDVAARLNKFSNEWCYYLGELEEDAEKYGAFNGLCMAIEKNPPAMIPSFDALCVAIASWETPAEAIAKMFGNLLRAYKQMLGQNWNVQFSRCGPESMAKLSALYNL